GRIGIDNEIPGGEGEGTDGKEEVADLVLEEVECDSESCGREMALGKIAVLMGWYQMRRSWYRIRMNRYRRLRGRGVSLECGGVGLECGGVGLECRGVGIEYGLNGIKC
ncbi:hypothetical protein U1Q18_042633, partial [Sarracenia purpurea var. burkii]